MINPQRQKIFQKGENLGPVKSKEINVANNIINFSLSPFTEKDLRFPFFKTNTLIDKIIINIILLTIYTFIIIEELEWFTISSRGNQEESYQDITKWNLKSLLEKI